VETYFDYLRAMAHSLGERIVQTYPALQTPKDAPAVALKTLLRKPLPAQALAITGLAKYLKTARSARIVAECGAGKTFMSLGTMHVHAGAGRYTALVMCPPHIVHKWAREALLTVPHARAFIVEDLRNGGDSKNSHGIVEVKLEKGQTVVRGITTTLPKLRCMGRKGWREKCPHPAFFIMGK
jgi:superfamily II DNA or RNA helicase